MLNDMERPRNKVSGKIIIPKEVAERAIPYKYNGIKNEYFSNNDFQNIIYNYLIKMFNISNNDFKIS